MSEEPTMVVPRSWNHVHDEDDPYLKYKADPAVKFRHYYKYIKENQKKKRVTYLFKNDVVLERCEYRVNSAICYSGNTQMKLRSLKLDFEIRQAVYSKMDDEKTMTDYLLLVGVDQICFYHLTDASFETVKIPFRIERVFSSDYGVLIERARLANEHEITEPGVSMCHIFSLSHPYSEVLPVLFRNKKEMNCRYAFTGERISLLSSSRGIILGYDKETEGHLIFYLRRCTPTEKEDAVKLLNTSVISFDSPGFPLKFPYVKSNQSTPKLLNMSPVEKITPLRRSIRNRAKQMAANVDPTKLFQHDYSSIGGQNSELSGISCFKSSIMSLRGSRMSGRQLPTPFNIGEQYEVDVDLILIGVWSEIQSNSTNTTPNGITVINTPQNLTPKSILSKKNTPIAGGDETPKMVKFEQKTKFIFKTNLDSEESSEINQDDNGENSKSRTLRNIYPTEEIKIKNGKIDKDSYPRWRNDQLLRALNALIKKRRSEIIESFMPKSGKKKSTVTKKGLNTVAEKDLDTVAEKDLDTVTGMDLDTVTGMDLGTVAEKDLGTVAEKDLGTVTGMDLGTVAEKDLDTVAEKNFPTVAKKTFGTVTKNVDISPEDYVKIRVNWMRYYMKMMHYKVKRKENKVMAFYALVLYRREVLRIWKNHLKANLGVYGNSRCASRFFVTQDKIGQKYIGFLSGFEEELKLIKWDDNRHVTIGTPVAIPAGDAVNVVGSKMMAIMNPKKENVYLYSGVHEIGNLIMSPINTNQCEILNFVESFEKSIIVRYQRRKNLDVKCVYFDLDFSSNSFLEKFFDGVFATLPSTKSMQFYSNWLALNHKIPFMGKENISKKKNLILEKTGSESLKKRLKNQRGRFIYLKNKNKIEKNEICANNIYEISLFLNHFFESLSLKVSGLEFSKILDQFHGDDESENLKKFKMSDFLDSEFSDFEEKKIFTVDIREGRMDILDRHGYHVFQLLHYAYESLNIYPQRSVPKIILEALFLFSKISNLIKFESYYLLIDKNLKKIDLNISKKIEFVPVSEAVGFNAGIVFTYGGFMSCLKSKYVQILPNIPKSFHWDPKTLFCAGVIVGKIRNCMNIKQFIGIGWQKKLNLLNDDEKKLLKILTSKKCQESKGLKCMKILRMSIGDFLIIGNEISEIFKKCLNSWTTSCDNGVKKKKLNVFPTDEEQKKWANFRWPTDIRLENAYQMLDSSKAVLIPSHKVEDMEDEKSAMERYDLFLLSTYPKTVSKAFGKALLGFSSTRASKVNFEMIPKIELGGKVAPNHIQPFPHSEYIQSQHEWAEFFAGTCHVISLADFENDKINFGWLRQWQEEAANSLSMAAGCCFGFGLTGQFRNVNLYDIHSMIISSKRSMDTIAILLSCAINFRGTSHLQFYRTVVTHLPTFIEPTLVELKFEPIVQVASILSLGFLFQGTTNASLTNKLINEMARETFFENDPAAERYNYVLCAGISIGLINLGRGLDIRNSEIPIKHGNYEIETRLYCLLNGEKRILCTDFGRRNKNLCKIQRIGIAGLNSANYGNGTCTGIDYATIHGIGLTSENIGINTPFNEGNKITANSSTGILAKESSHTKELPFVNIHLTSPAAAIALGFMYLKTKDNYILNILKVPDTVPLIEKIRPDVLMIRTLCAMLVDYDNISTNPNELEMWIPSVVRRYIRITLTDKKEEFWWSGQVDMTTIAEAYYYIRTGISLALGIKFASTFNEAAFKIIDMSNCDLDPEQRGSNPLSRYVRDAVVNNCCAINALAMSMVMAGSGDLHTLRFLRKIKNFYQSSFSGHEADQTTFSVHTLANMGIGMLFLGNGKYGFCKSNEAIAMLVLSVFPIFPHNIGDNRCYFQPLRFMWCLATEFRHLCPVEDENLQPVKMQAKIIFKNNEEKIFQLPGLMPPLDDVIFINLNSRNYKKIEIDLNIEDHRKKLNEIFKNEHGRILVKRVYRKFQKIFEQVPIFEKEDKNDIDENCKNSEDLPTDILSILKLN